MNETVSAQPSDTAGSETENGGAARQELAETLYASMRAGRTDGLPLRDEDAARLEACDRFRFGEEDALVGWEIGNGPLVFLVHGWGGRGAQMSGLAHFLAQSGFRAVFFDAGSHGESEIGPIGFDRFMEDAAALQHYMGATPYAWIGHSAGALAMMRGRRTHGIHADRYACLAAPFLPYVPIERIRAMGTPEPIIELIKPMIASQFAASWDELRGGAAWEPEPEARLLLAYDSDDKLVHPEDGDRAMRIWPDAVLLRTKGNGHNRILGSESVRKGVIAHLTNE